MVHHHRKHDFGDRCFSRCRKAKPTVLRIFLLLFVSSLSLVSAAFLLFPCHRPLDEQSPPCSSVANSSICCDRTAFRTDVCFMKGDVRTDSVSSSVFLVSHLSATEAEEERIRPYTRKWEPHTMSTIDELRLRRTANETAAGPCDVRHDVPAVFFSTGGYTGNVYHEFNDGIIPLYITSHQFHRRVVFVILEYHGWWISKYADILSQLSDFPPIDFSGDNRTHCFPEAVVGLNIHDELAIDPARMGGNKTIRDFRRMLDAAYKPRIQSIVAEQHQSRPKLVIISRNGSRRIENEGELVRLAEDIGFEVKVMRPTRTTELARVYRALDTCDAMVGVHGAAMTHLLFMRPGSVVIQVVPLGTGWAAETYYGRPARRLGLSYDRYAISPRESSLYREYERDDPVLRDPESVNTKGWEETKKVYLDGQSVRLDLRRFRKRLVKAHRYLVSKKSG